jgi:hypothetical protein
MALESCERQHDKTLSILLGGLHTLLDDRARAQVRQLSLDWLDRRLASTAPL